MANVDRWDVETTDHIFEQVMEGEFSREEANEFIQGFNHMVGFCLLGEVPTHTEQRIRGSITFEYEVTLEIPVEHGDDDIDQGVAVAFEHAMQGEEGAEMTVQDIRITQAWLADR